jgi:hypothetical protein
MKSTVKHAIASGVAHYTAGSVEVEDVTDELFLLVCQSYLKDHGYLPKEWEEHLEKEVNKSAPRLLVLPQ